MSEWENGLPGVGERCEVLDPKSGGWNRIEITGEGCDVLIAKRFERSEEEFMLNKTCEFHPIKKREPQPGEVWSSDDGFFECMTELGGMRPFGAASLLCGSNTYDHKPHVIHRMKFAATSLEAYYEKKIARKFLEESNELCGGNVTLFSVVIEASKIGEE